MIIDSHQHFWNYTAEEFAWVTEEMAVLRRDYLPDDLELVMKESGVTGAITVQARPSLKETNWLLDLAARQTLIKGIVGWVPLKDPALGVLLDRLTENAVFRGAREVIQGAPDDQFFDHPGFNRGIRELTLREIPFDLLIFHHQLGRSSQFVDAHPNQVFILDHLAKPEIRHKCPVEWARGIRILAERPNVFCKFSGLATEVREDSWDAELIRPYFEVVLEAFGEDRVMFGSDWPVCLLRTDYVRWLSVIKELATGLSESGRETFFSQTASTVYGLKV